MSRETAQKKIDEFSENYGFTLIELLVTIVIIGLLGAISLPNYLKQTSKARGAEGKSNLSIVNRSQQIFRFQTGRMANDLSLLEARITAKYYTYSVSSSDSNNAAATAVSIPGGATDLNNFSAAVTQVVGSSTQTEFFGSIICKTNDVNQSPSAATAPTSQGSFGTCPSGMEVVK